MKLSPAVLSTATESVLLKQYKLLGAVIDAPWATRLDHKIARHVIERYRYAPSSVLWDGLNTRPCRETTPARLRRVGSRCRPARWRELHELAWLLGHPTAIGRFKRNLDRISAAGDQIDAQVAGSFRELVDSVVVMPRKPGEPYRLETRGRLAGLIGAPVGAAMSAKLVVPVERIELPTFGLQNRLSVNRISAERVPKAEFVDSIIGYFESRN